VITAPPRRILNWTPSTVTAGISEFRRPWRTDHPRLGEPLTARRADVVLRELLEELGADLARHRPGHDRAERDGRQDEVPERRAGIAEEARVAHRREPAQHEREEKDQHSRPEARHRDAEERAQHGQEVDVGVSTHGGERARGQGGRSRQEAPHWRSSSSRLSRA
jgi:hypothetical protein